MPEERLTGHEKVLIEDEITLTNKTLSKSVSVLISMSGKYGTLEYQNLIYEDLTKFICGQIGEEFSREAYTYAEIFGFSLMVRVNLI